MFPDSPRLLARQLQPVAGEPLPWDPAMVTPTPSQLDAVRRPDESAAALALLDPTPSGHAALDALPAPALSDGGLLDAITATEKQLAAIAGKQQEFLAEIAKRDPDHDQFVREEAAFALHQSDNVTSAKLDEAEQLTGRLTDTLDLARSGYLSPANARILAHAVQELSDEIAVKVQDKVLPRGCTQTPGEFRAAVRRAVARFDRKDEKARHEKEYADRKVVHYPDADCMADIWLRLGADGAAIVMTAINAWAARVEPGDTRTVDQRRADAIVEICLAALNMPGLPAQHGARPTINITLATTTLAGLDDYPGEMDGYGPVPADVARRWAADPTGKWYWWLVDPDGRILDRTVPRGDCPHCAQTDDPDPKLRTDSYVPSPSLARHVITRDQHCAAPGCRRKAWNCDLDHRVPWPDGPTNAENLEPLCRRHHRMKHHPGWRARKHQDGSYEWTSPTRHSYRYRPPERPVAEPPPTATPAIDDDPPPF